MIRWGLFLLIAILTDAEPRFANLPFVFEPAPDSRAFLARSGDASILIRGDETVLAAGRRERVRVRLVGANSKVRVRGMDLQPGRSNYLTGSDASRWRTGI